MGEVEGVVGDCKVSIQRGERKGVREVIWRGTAKTEGHMRGRMETYYSRRFLNIYRSGGEE